MDCTTFLDILSVSTEFGVLLIILLPKVVLLDLGGVVERVICLPSDAVSQQKLTNYKSLSTNYVGYYVLHNFQVAR